MSWSDSPSRRRPAEFDGIRETYFSQGWAQSADAPAPIPAVAAAFVPRDEGGPVHVEHAQVAHMYITRKAFEIYVSRFPGSELSRYIGDYSGGLPAARDDANVVAGSYDEDEPYYNPFNEVMPSNRHFWNFRGGVHAGLGGFDSSINRAYKYFSGGYGVDGRYDEGWSPKDGKRRGVKGLGAVALYRSGEKAKAYWYLGHAAHLLEDLTVPAHAHLWAHVVAWMDAYETYMTAAHVRWPAAIGEPVESFDSLLDIFLETAQVTDRYDAGNAGGFSGGVDGSVDKGRRRSGGFTKAKLDEEAAVLMPLAYRRTAALFRFFYKQIDKTPPTVELIFPGGRDLASAGRISGSEVALAASARDDVSGLDPGSFLFFSSRRTDSGWTAWEAVSPLPDAGRINFSAASGGLYRFKATAQDAAGNIGESKPGYARVDLLGPDIVLRR